MGGKFLANMRRVSQNEKITIEEAKDLKAKLDSEVQVQLDKKDKLEKSYKSSLEKFDIANKEESLLVQNLESQKSLETPDDSIVTSLEAELKEATKKSITLSKALDKAKKAYDESITE